MRALHCTCITHTHTHNARRPWVPVCGLTSFSPCFDLPCDPAPTSTPTSTRTRWLSCLSRPPPSLNPRSTARFPRSPSSSRVFSCACSFVDRSVPSLATGCWILEPSRRSRRSRCDAPLCFVLRRAAYLDTPTTIAAAASLRLRRRFGMPAPSSVFGAHLASRRAGGNVECNVT